MYCITFQEPRDIVHVEADRFSFDSGFTIFYCAADHIVAAYRSGSIKEIETLDEEPDWDDEDYEYVEPLTEEELMIQRLMNKAVENVYSDEALKILKAQTPFCFSSQVKPLPVASGKEIQFFSYAPVPALTQEQLQDELSYRAQKSLEFVTQQTGVRSGAAPFDAAMKQVADRRLEEQAGNESAANEAKVASEHYWDEKGDWSSPHTGTLKAQPAPEPVTTDSLWSKYYKAEREARETLVALQDELFAKQRQDSTEKAVYPKDSDLCSFENIITGATCLWGIDGVNVNVELAEKAVGLPVAENNLEDITAYCRTERGFSNDSLRAKQFEDFSGERDWEDPSIKVEGYMSQADPSGQLIITDTAVKFVKYNT